MSCDVELWHAPDLALSVAKAASVTPAWTGACSSKACFLPLLRKHCRRGMFRHCKDFVDCFDPTLTVQQPAQDWFHAERVAAHGVVRKPGVVVQGSTAQHSTWQSTAQHSTAQHLQTSTACSHQHGSIRYEDLAQVCTLQQSMAWHSVARHITAWHSTATHSTAHSAACHSS